MVNSKLKFRAWDKNRKKMWSHSDLYKMDCSNEYPFLALIRGFYATNMFPGEEMDVIPMQFTGLYDKNGKEIYEGDIVKFHFPNPYNTVVKFKNGHFAFYKGKRMMVDPYYYTNHVWSYAEVIGNIYEHKHLLG